MSTVAWDGKSLAADKQLTGSYKQCGWKITMMPDGVVAAGVGDTWRVLALFQWYSNGADPEKWPFDYDDTPGSRQALILADKKMVVEFEVTCAPVSYPRGQKLAWGHGADFAMGAMAAGCGAKRAVEIASDLDTYTGKGVDVMEPTSSALAKTLAWGLVKQIRPTRPKTGGK